MTYYLTAKDGYKFTTAPICTINGVTAVLIETQMAHASENGKCITCSYNSTQSEDVPTDNTETAPSPTVVRQQNKDNGGIPWWGFLLIGVGATGIGIGACVLVLNKKKKE